MIKPCAIDKFSIYDISKKDESTIVTALPYQKLNISINSKSGEVIHCPHNHCKIYKFDCSQSSLDIEVNNQIYSVNPSSYTSFKDKIVFSVDPKEEILKSYTQNTSRILQAPGLITESKVPKL